MEESAEEEVVENPTLRAAYNLAPLHHNQPLCWDYEVKLIGEKIYDKIIHLCETCELPILVYGRLLPCKHIFCFDCARKCDKSCKRCCAKVQKVEKSALGTVYVCTHGAPKHSTKGCRRTYLSQRDLQAHINHRHEPKRSGPNSSSAPLQPAPNQLPLTKQQAAQLASQKQAGGQDMSHSSPVQPQHIPSVLPGQNNIALPMNSIHQQPSGLPINSQQLSPAQSHIPGLGDLRQLGSAAQSGLGQNSPLMQPPQSPGNMQGMSLPYGGASQTNQDMFHPMDMGQQQQQSMGIPNSHLQSNQTHQSYPQSSQFPTSSMMQQMNSQQISSTSSASLHPNTFTHSHQPVSGPPNLDNYSEMQDTPPSQVSQSRTNVNLITVPIQDEGQYRPIPYVTSLPPHQNPTYSPARLNMPSQNQSYTQPQMSSLNSFPQMAPQPQQSLPTSNNPQCQQFNQQNQLHPNSPGMLGTPRQVIGGSLHPQNRPRIITDVMHAAMTMAARGQGNGMLPTPGVAGQAVGGGLMQAPGGGGQGGGGGLMPTPGAGGGGFMPPQGAGGQGGFMPRHEVSGQDGGGFMLSQGAGGHGQGGGGFMPRHEVSGQDVGVGFMPPHGVREQSGGGGFMPPQGAGGQGGGGFMPRHEVSGQDVGGGFMPPHGVREQSGGGGFMPPQSASGQDGGIRFMPQPGASGQGGGGGFLPQQGAGGQGGGGGGLMLPSVVGGQGIVNRFPPAGHWPPQRMLPPRMQQSPQQRPQNEDQFNQSGYYH